MAGFLVSSVRRRKLIASSTCENRLRAARFENTTRISASITSNPSRISLTATSSRADEKSIGAVLPDSGSPSSRRGGSRLLNRRPKPSPRNRASAERMNQGGKQLELLVRQFHVRAVAYRAYVAEVNHQPTIFVAFTRFVVNSSQHRAHAREKLLH